MRETENVSRRQFLTGGATVFLGGLLGGLTGHALGTMAQDGKEDGGVLEKEQRDRLISDLLSGLLRSCCTEITDFHIRPHARKNEDGRFAEETGTELALGDLFFVPAGTEIFLTARNPDIVPFLRCGESFMLLDRREPFIRCAGAGWALFCCRTTAACSWLGISCETDGSGVLTADSLRAADPHLYIRFPGCVLQTQEAARIRTLGVGRNCERLFTVVHITDTHGDADSTHAAFEYADRIGADFIALSGDYVPYYPEHGLDMLHSLIRGAKTPTVCALGNHDVITCTDRQAYEECLAPIRDTILASDEHPYYYRDFQCKGETVRVICLYPFYEKARVRKKGYYTEEQLLWLCEALASAPDGMHVFIVRHFSHHRPVPADADHAMFYDYDDSVSDEDMDLWLNMSKDPVPAIVDAYNQKERLSARYTGELEDGKTETVTVKYDFTDRPDSEFVAYFTGHVHVDAVGFARSTKTRQAVLSSLCTTGVKGTEAFDYYTERSSPRDYGTDSQIALDIYAFDFHEKKIYVARAGNGLFQDREKTWMELPYRQTDK